MLAYFMVELTVKKRVDENNKTFSNGLACTLAYPLFTNVYLNIMYLEARLKSPRRHAFTLFPDEPRHFSL